VCIESKHGGELGLLSICPSPSSPSPYILVARSQGTGGVRYILQHWYTTLTHILTRITLGPSLMGLRGTQVTCSIIYTLVTMVALPPQQHEPDAPPSLWSTTTEAWEAGCHPTMPSWMSQRDNTTKLATVAAPGKPSSPR
jgi:hypothetical protein